MRNRFLLLLAVILCSAAGVQAQECLGTTMKAGSGFEMTNYDGKGKPTGTINYKIAKVSSQGGMSVITIEMEVFNPKGKSELKNSYDMKCDGNTLYLDASTMINQEQMKSFENFQMKYTSTNIEFPNKFISIMLLS